MSDAVNKHTNNKLVHKHTDRLEESDDANFKRIERQWDTYKWAGLTPMDINFLVAEVNRLREELQKSCTHAIDLVEIGPIVETLKKENEQLKEKIRLTIITLKEIARPDWLILNNTIHAYNVLTDRCYRTRNLAIELENK
jgi:hypothetical protein